jgi:D-threonate/D-erythronate kinase
MIGVIADDLTGAAELGAVGLRHGLRAEIVRDGEPSGRADLVCVDTDSRSCEPVHAGARAAAAAKLLRAAGAKWIYKKVDSVLRGQVTAEIESVMRQLNLEKALLLPANPSLGRTIRDGQYFVLGKPIHKTEFARDPEYPRRSSQVMRLMQAPENFLLRIANGDRSLSAGTIVIGEASTTADLQSWTPFCDAGMLPAGGAEFFNALLDSGAGFAPNRQTAGEIGNFETPRQAGRAAAGREFFISGTSARQARQFALAQKRRQIPVISLPKELGWGAAFTPAAVDAVAQRVLAAFQDGTRVVLSVGLPPVRDLAIARKLSLSVVLVAEQVMRETSIARVFAEGGATAAELVRRMNWPRLDVVRELAPGVATLAVGDAKLLLTIKPGTYIWPAQWTSEPIVC